MKTFVYLHAHSSKQFHKQPTENLAELLDSLGNGRKIRSYVTATDPEVAEHVAKMAQY